MTSTAATLQLIDELAEADMTAFPAKVWAVAMEAERLGTPTPIVDALLDTRSPVVVRQRALARIAGRVHSQASDRPTSSRPAWRASSLATR